MLQSIPTYVILAVNCLAAVLFAFYVFSRPTPFLKLLLSDSRDISIKRFTTLLALLHFIMTSFVVLFLKSNIVNENLLRQVLEYDFYIIMVGVFGVTVESVMTAMVERSRVISGGMVAAAAAARPDVVVNKTDNVNATGGGDVSIEQKT